MKIILDGRDAYVHLQKGEVPELIENQTLRGSVRLSLGNLEKELNIELQKNEKINGKFIGLFPPNTPLADMSRLTLSLSAAGIQKLEMKKSGYSVNHRTCQGDITIYAPGSRYHERSIK
ncbi:MAG: hypothetical protein WDZ77_01830 [Candidatus Pacearchaeota archaeon]